MTDIQESTATNENKIFFIKGVLIVFRIAYKRIAAKILQKYFIGKWMNYMGELHI